MPPSKSKSGVAETNGNKGNSLTPRISKIGRTPSKSESDLRSPLPSSRLSVDRSPKSVDSKAALQRRFSKSPFTPDKQPRATAVKASLELEERLNMIQKDFEKTKEQLISVESEKAQILEELNEARICVNEANEKLAEALAARRCAEENSEIEKFRAVEIEQAGIEAAQQREEVWQKEIEDVRGKHALDVSALVSATHELHRVKQELAMLVEAKNTALSHADDAMKIAEMNAEKVEMLSGEITRLKALLDARMESMNDEAAERIRGLNSEIDGLKCELEMAKETEKKVVEMDSLIEGLREEVRDAKRAELDAFSLVEEWKTKVELLESKLEEITGSHRTTSESLTSTIKQLEVRDSSLQDAESEIAGLKGKVESLEVEVKTCKEDLDEADRQLEAARNEKSELEKTIKVLKSEFQRAEEEMLEVMENRKLANTKVQSLSQEKDVVLNELERSREEVEHSKKAMDDLASALHEVSAQAREAKELLLIKQAEVADFQDQIVELEFAVKSTEERYESAIDDLKDEIFRLKSDLEKSESEAENSRSEWNEKELTFLKSLKDMEVEYTGLKTRMDEISRKVENMELELATAKDERVRLLDEIKEVEAEAASAQEAAEDARVKSVQLKERLLDKENELQSITQENEDLRAREDTALKRINELSRLLEEAMTKATEEVDTPLSDEKGRDVVVNGHQEHNVETLEEQAQHDGPKEGEVDANGSCKQEEKPAEAEPEKQDSSFRFDEKVTSNEPDPECESVDYETESKMDGEDLNPPNGSAENMGCSPIKEEQQKKKTPLLRKFGSLLKKNKQK